jgi:hypothetical protein
LFLSKTINFRIHKRLIWKFIKQKKYGNILSVNAGQFFSQSDFDAFSEIYHQDKSIKAKELRKQVRDKFIDLDKMIFDDFRSYDMNDLYHPANKRNYTSQYFHTPRNSQIKDALWLNYGKSSAQLNKDSFTNHCRIQVILRHDSNDEYIGIWLFISKGSGVNKDKERLFDNIKNPVFLQLIYEYVRALGNAYFIELGKCKIKVADIKRMDNIVDFIEKNKNLPGVFYVGRNYDPNNTAISTDNIKNTILSEFSKLYELITI